MPIANYQPNERYAVVGKTRSGKTAFAMVLAGTFARALPPPWQVWWIDTKNDPDDLIALRKWGFRNAVSDEDRSTSLITNALYWYIDSEDKDRHDVDTVVAAQEIMSRAYKRRNVLLIVDEYTSVVPSSTNPGKALRDVFSRGGGRGVGIIGLTQEPVYVPRQLLSQATHQALFTLTHQNDIDKIKKMEPGYVPPIKLGHPHGFWWKWIDGNGELVLYPNQKIWYDQLRVAMPRNKGLEEGTVTVG